MDIQLLTKDTPTACGRGRTHIPDPASMSEITPLGWEAEGCLEGGAAKEKVECFPLEVKITEACSITGFLLRGVLDPKLRWENQEPLIHQLLLPEARLRWKYSLFGLF